jgi:hypothetical protein
MRFHSFSSSADDAIDRFNKSTLADTDFLNVIYYQKLALCDFQILLVSLDEPDMQRLADSSYDFPMLVPLFSAWQVVAKNPLNIADQEKAWRIIDQVGGVLESDGKVKSHPGLRRFRNNLAHDHYFLLLSGQEPQGLPVSELGPLCNIWQLVNGHLPLHAAGVIHKGQLFVFTGPSGAGKSTVTKLSQESGDTVLEEDQLLIYKALNGDYHADAWGYNLAFCNLPIRAIFKLIQDTEDKIVPIKPVNFAHLLFERHNDIMGNQFSDDLLKHSFEFIAGLARQVPGYVLHFRKSPDFWKLIDERFPD